MEKPLTKEAVRRIVRREMRKFLDSLIPYVSESEQEELEKIITTRRLREKPSKTGLEWIGR